MAVYLTKAKTPLTTEDTEDAESGKQPEQLRQFRRLVEQHVWRGFAQGVRSESVGYSARPCSGIAAGKDVHTGVAHDQGLIRSRAGLAQDGLCPLRVRLFGGKAVAPVHPDKKLAQTHSFDNELPLVH